MGIFDVFARKDAEYYKVKYYESNEIYQKGRQAMADGNQAKGFKLYCKAAEGYNWMAKYMVGACYEDGTGVAKNNPKAFEIYSKVAKETFEHGDLFSDFFNKCGIGLAKYRMGLFLQNGWDVPQDTAKSLEIFSGMNTDTDSAEAVFFAATELHINYHHGKNGCPQDFSQSHRYALRGLDAFELYNRDSQSFKFSISGASLNNHLALLQYVAYNCENGRGVDKNLEKAIRYRLKAYDLYKRPDDAYCAGADYYSLGNIKEAKKMLKIAQESDSADCKRWATEKLDEIKTARDKAYKESKASHLKAVEAEDEKALLREASFKAWGRRKFYTGELFGFVSKTIPQDIDWALRTVLDIVEEDVLDFTPLPYEDFSEKGAYMLEGWTEQEVLESYAAMRIFEKSGLTFDVVSEEYLGLAVKTAHIESAFRYEQLCRLVFEHKEYDLDICKYVTDWGRPVYGVLSQPTLALVQLAKNQDPEAIVDLARIYKEKGNEAMVDALRYIAAAIYKNRADAGDPEAIYNLGCIISQAEHDHSAVLFDYHSIFYLCLANLNRYGKAIADLSSDRIPILRSFEKKMTLRQMANDAEAFKESYFPYINANRSVFNDHMMRAYYFHEDLLISAENNPDDAAAIKYGYYEKVFNFVLSKKPFTDPEMLQLIADGVIDALGDKPLADIIKRATIPPSEEELTLAARIQELQPEMKQMLAEELKKDTQQ